MKSRGFTLIELLAVIVILAIIALIATPIVLGIIEDSDKNAWKETANGIISAGEYYYLRNTANGKEMKNSVEFTFPNAMSGLEFDGEVPSGGIMTINTRGEIYLNITDGKYVAVKDFDSSKVIISKKVSDKTDEEENDKPSTGDTTVVDAITYIKNYYGDETNYASNGLYIEESTGLLYYAGTSEDTVNNYIRFEENGDEWRIISMSETQDYIKIIRYGDTNMKSVYDADKNTDWASSDILANLNSWYTSNLTAYSNIIIANPNWNLTQMTTKNDASSVVATDPATYNASPIGLITATEYAKSIPSGEAMASWLWLSKSSDYQWTMTKYSASAAIRVNDEKYANSGADSETIYRPVIYLNNNSIDLVVKTDSLEQTYFLISKKTE